MVCTKCGEDKELFQFCKRSASSGRLRKQCRDCINHRRRERRKANPEAYKATNRDWYERNKDRIKAYSAQYRRDNPDICRLSQASWRQINPNKIKSVSAAYYQLHKGRMLAKNKQWLRDNPGKINEYSTKRRASKMQRTPHWLTEDDYKWVAWHYKHAKKMEEVTGVVHHVDHIVPLQGKYVSGLHCPLNLQVIPASENLSKSNIYNT